MSKILLLCDNKDQVPPPNQREQVPLGSSSASMYPGYSPADHEYGKAAEEYGKAAAEARARGIELKHPDAEYEVGQAKGVRRKTLAELQETRAATGRASGSGSGSGTGSGSEGPIIPESKEPATTNGQASTEKNQEANPQGDNPYFIIDTKPTPVKIPGTSSQPLKRSPSPTEAIEAKHKKAKKRHDVAVPGEDDAQEVKTEDISERVDARMKEKEKKRKMKEEKKRKRDSEGEHAAAAEEAHETAEPPAVVPEAERPKKKKKKAKKSEEEALPDQTASKKRRGEDEGEAEDGEGKKKKKRKKNGAVVNDE